MITLTADDVIRKQSVRATFKLPQQSISLLCMVAKQLKVKQKSLFDQLIDDPAVLRQVILEAKDFVQDDRERQQKTFVISRNSLASITQTAKQANIPRDLLLEISICRLMPIIEKELERQRKMKDIVVDMQKHLEQGEEILAKADALLGSDDRLCEMLEKQLQMARRDIAEIETHIEQGAAMEASIPSVRL